MPRSLKKQQIRLHAQTELLTEMIAGAVVGDKVIIKINEHKITLGINLTLINYLNSELEQMQQRAERLTERQIKHFVTFTPSASWTDYIDKKRGWK